MIAPYAARNTLFYPPDGRALSVREAEARVKGPERSVNISATRFRGSGAADLAAASPAASDAAGTPRIRGCVPDCVGLRCQAST